MDQSNKQFSKQLYKNIIIHLQQNIFSVTFNGALLVSLGDLSIKCSRFDMMLDNNRFFMQINEYNYTNCQTMAYKKVNIHEI